MKASIMLTVAGEADSLKCVTSVDFKETCNLMW